MAAFEPAPEIQDYQDVPFFRRRWFFVTSFAVLTPAAIAIACSGQIYARQDDAVVRYADKTRRQLTAFMSIFYLLSVSRVFLG